VFINADQVLGSTPFLETLYKKDWKRKVENSALTTEDLQSAYERTKLDKMARLEDQLNWLEEAGFSDVDCVYKYFSFVVMFGRKINEL
jgi:tRNA (cmo5U34)-methyltransferase